MRVTALFTRESITAVPLIIAVTGMACCVSCVAGPQRGAMNVFMQSNTSTSSGTTRNGSSSQVETKSSTAVNASDAGKSFSKPYGTHLEPILEKIGATTEQRKRIATIVQSYKPKIEPLREEYRLKSSEFIDFIVHGQSAEVIMARQGELNNLYGGIITEYSLMRMEIRRLLTPQQCRDFEVYRAQQGWKSK